MRRPHLSALTRSALALAAGVIVIDQLTKWWAETSLTPGAANPVIGELIQWRLVYNPGAAFGLAAEHTWILTIIAALAVTALFALAGRMRTRSGAVAVGILLGGAISHLGDRLIRTPGFARGHIVDFIDYNGFFVGNVADIAIVCGVAALALLNIFRIEPAAPPEPARPDTA
ncbi:signal peptidase II [Nocardia bovistercoris]|uniref:Lipoprotein signal peptidase n=1 Tax=Nocardia bovistercoris TaxID=2785916 RepID=A0A931IH94_9NOCA|nr:signal peptidase II [Nocardia bovistercoris]MBH0780002.1 signal peptidase II [Nocardia bovistercoris]